MSLEGVGMEGWYIPYGKTDFCRADFLPMDLHCCFSYMTVTRKKFMLGICLFQKKTDTDYQRHEKGIASVSLGRMK